MSAWPPPHLWGKKSHLKLNVIQFPCNGENWGKECLNTVWNGCYECSIYRLCVLCMRLLLFRDLQGCIRDFHQIIYIWDFIPFAFLYLPSNDVLYVFVYACLVNCVICLSVAHIPQWWCTDCGPSCANSSMWPISLLVANILTKQKDWPGDVQVCCYQRGVNPIITCRFTMFKQSHVLCSLQLCLVCTGTMADVIWALVLLRNTSILFSPSCRGYSVHVFVSIPACSFKHAVAAMRKHFTIVLVCFLRFLPTSDAQKSLHGQTAITLYVRGESVGSQFSCRDIARVRGERRQTMGKSCLLAGRSFLRERCLSSPHDWYF